MHWPLFWISTAAWIFFGSHFVFSSRLALLAENGVDVPRSMIVASKAFATVAFINLIAFFFIFGATVSWLQASVIVPGGYLASLFYVLIFRDRLLTITHKIGWLAIPALSVAIWFVAYSHD